MLAINLDRINLKGRKLFANLQRFQRPVKTSNKFFRVRDSSASLANNNGVQNKGRADSGWVDKRSFADVMMNRKATTQSYEAGLVSKSFSMAGEVEDLNKYGKEFTGVLRNSTMVSELKNLFIEEGIFIIRVTLLGPNLCLLEDLIHGEVDIFIEERKDWWGQRFSSIRASNPSDIDSERLVWLKISGLPCHAWAIKLFKLISESYSAFIKCNDHIVSRLRMDDAKFLVNSRHEALINEECIVIVDGESYRCFWKEEHSSTILNAIARIVREEEEYEFSSSLVGEQSG